MRAGKEDISRIKAAFETMQSRRDLLALLNKAKPFVYGKKATWFELRQLTWYADPKLSSGRYRKFEIQKKSGQSRTIHAPVRGLKAIQRTLAFILQCVFEPHKAATGFVKQRSIVDNARVHARSRYVYNIDLKDFFPSIDQARVWKCLQLEPFGLKGTAGAKGSRRGRQDLANIIASLCCAHMEVERMDAQGEWAVVEKNVLPQGAPTSPVLSNLVCQRMDYLLSAVGRRFGLRYTRYADDMTFSSAYDAFAPDHGFIQELHRIIAEQGFHIKESKTRLQKEGYRQEVTGLLVNDKPNVPKRYVKELRMWLNYWERYGLPKANRIFATYHGNQQMPTGKKPAADLQNVIGGKLDFLSMVKGKDDTVFTALKKRYDKLTQVSSPQPPVAQIPQTRKPRKTRQKTPGTVKPPRPKKPFPHDPVFTARFLRNFKHGDGSGFKELVHDTELTPELLDQYLNQVKNNPNFISHYKGERVTDIHFLNKKLQSEVIELIDAFEREGKPYYNITGEHPYQKDKAYTKTALDFKLNYRFGSGDEYSELIEELKEPFMQIGIPATSVVYLPDPHKFGLRAEFFTWKPALMSGIKYLLHGIVNHLNIDGTRVKSFQDKKIHFECSLPIEQDGLTYTELRIFDERSKAMVTSDKLWTNLTNSNAYSDYFRGLCDWAVECDFADDEPPARLNLLVAKEVKPKKQELEPLPQPVGGYKNILRFYEIP